MIDMITGFFSTILGMNLKDPHDIPFALPLMLAAGIAFVNGFVVLHWIDKERKQESLQISADKTQNSDPGNS
jgi:hypothetical protein